MAELVFTLILSCSLLALTMEYLETIVECEEPLDESFFLVVKRPGRKSCSVVKHSTPGRSQLTEFTISALGEKGENSEFLAASKSRPDFSTLDPAVNSRGDTLSTIQTIKEEDVSIDSREPGESQEEPQCTAAPTWAEGGLGRPRDSDQASSTAAEPPGKPDEVYNRSSSTGLHSTTFFPGTSFDSQRWLNLQRRKARARKSQNEASLTLGELTTSWHSEVSRLDTIPSKGKSDQTSQRRRDSKTKKLKLREQLRAQEWVILQMIDIEEATKHELTIE
ncbi:uncharacterized protein [Lepisosteus oculatus]|uniref:uncharacterized protein isoform X1 n=2 Tax=Lepisosteus oculatus TaxID=7918 RepID=UPI003711737E